MTQKEDRKTHKSHEDRPNDDGENRTLVYLVPVDLIPDPMDVSQPGDSFTTVTGSDSTNHTRPFVPKALLTDDAVSDVTHTDTRIALMPHMFEVHERWTTRASNMM